MKKNIIILLTVFILVLGFFLLKKKDASVLNLNYVEPIPKFFDSSLVKSSDIVVKITDSSFVPEVLNIKRGDRVIWVNISSGYSWPASNPHPTHTDYPEFDPKLPMKLDQAWVFTFDRVGSWGYHDHLNPSRRGRVIVE